MIGTIYGKDGRKVELVRFLRKECDGLETGFGLSRASGESGVVFESIIFDQITERETVSEKESVYGCAVYRLRVFFIKCF